MIMSGYADPVPPYTTDRDPTLEHQVVIQSHPPGHHIKVSCNCRLKYNTGKGGVVGYDPIGTVEDAEDTKRLYNDPANHWKPFSKEDELKW